MADIARLEREREGFRVWACDARDTLRAQNLTGMPRGTCTDDLSDVVAEAMRRAELYEAQVQMIDAEISDRIRLRNCMQELLQRLSPLQEKVICDRYAHGYGWRYIAMRLNYDEAHVKRVERQAVDFIAQHIQVNTK